MANTTLTNLPTVTGLNGTEPLLGVQNSASVQITTGQIAGLSKGSSTLPFPVSIGGTGDTTLTQYGLMYGNGTAPVGVVSPPSGTNYVLVGSSGSAPTWQPTIPVTAGVDSISFGTTGLTPSTAQAGVITVAGTLVAANGGTGQSNYTIGDLLYASGTTALSRLADVATGNALLSGGVGAAPSWGQVSLTTTVTGTLPITNGGTGQASALTQYGLVYGASATAMGITAAGTTGQVLIATTSGAPTWGSVPSTAAVTSITFGTTGLTPSTATTGAVTVAGTLVAANGGTGQSSYAVGDLLYASTTTALSRLADVATGSILVSGGVSTAPVWSASPTITTSITTPLVIGGTAVSSTLTLQSTSGVGTTDSILFKVGNAGATTAMIISTVGLVTANNFGSSSSAITGGSINGTTVGASTASTGAFTTLSASSTVSGTGFSTYLASPPAIGGTAAAAGAFTTLSASSTVSGTGFSTYLASPPAIGGTAAAAGTFTTATAATVVGTHNAYANIIALTDAATIAVDMSVTGGNNFSVTLAGNRTLGNPTGLTAGQSGIIYVTQDATGSRTLAYSSYWKFPGGTAPTLTTTANAVDALVYTVRTSTSITVQSLLNIA